MWCAVSKARIIGPFFTKTVNVKRYQQIIKLYCLFGAPWTRLLVSTGWGNGSYSEFDIGVFCRMHHFSITGRYVVLTCHPLIFSYEATSRIKYSNTHQSRLQNWKNKSVKRTTKFRLKFCQGCSAIFRKVSLFGVKSGSLLTHDLIFCYF